jgi:hypothetical protein
MNDFALDSVSGFDDYRQGARPYVIHWPGAGPHKKSQCAKWAEELNLIAHTTRAQFPLASTEDRNNFLHGMRWNNP